MAWEYGGAVWAPSEGRVGDRRLFKRRGTAGERKATMTYGDYEAYDQVDETAGRTAVRSPQMRSAVTGPAPAPVASPPQEAPVSGSSPYERALDRGSRLSLKVAGVLLALLAVVFVASLVYTSVAGAVSKASSAASAVSAPAASESVAEQTSSDIVSEVVDAVRGYASSAQGVADVAERAASGLEALADKAASALTELSYSLSR